MSMENKIFGIYTDGPVTGRVGNFYRILYLFSERGSVEKEVMRRVFQHNFKKDESEIVFETKDDLNKYLYLLSQEEDVAGVCILSVEEYNAISEEIFTKTDLLKAIEANAHCIENMDFRLKRGLFGKIFT
jgi:hypothetical protein